jgi:HK97 family phage prohead protease
MKTTTTPAIEKRAFSAKVELRAAADGAPKIVRGYAAMFGKRSSNLGSENYQFFEIIERGAFDDVLNDDVRALINHDSNLILARSVSGAGTLKIGADDVGLWYEFEPDAEQSYARDLVRSLARGDITQSSFAFSLTQEGQKWEETREGEKTVILRTIKKVARLYDVSPVTNPAYPDATVALRSLEEFRAEQKPAPATEPTFPLRSLWAARLGLRN